MNTLDFKPFKFPGKNWLNDIYEKHSLLVNKYLEYEGKIENFDINTYEDQALFKNYLEVRFIEEICEALDDKDNKDHFLEELIDAFNFLIATYYIYGIKPQQLSLSINPSKGFEKDFLNIVVETGMVCNLLKNRPWRHSQYLVDLLVFEERFLNLWKSFYSLLRNLKIDDKTIYEQWSLKYQVNLFRIETNY